MTEPTQSNESVLLRVEGLAKAFRLPGGVEQRAVDGVDLQLRRGEVLGLVGESGSGKSTLGKLLLGLHDKSAGAVVFDGERLPDRYGKREFQRYAQRMQMVFQDPYTAFNARLTVGESLAEPLRLANRKSLRLSGGKRNTDIERRVGEWLERVGLRAEMADRWPHEFSGGQRQRLGIARALIGEPELLVCDEPVSALDVSVQAQVINLLSALRRELGLAMIFITHDLAVVRFIADRIAVMQYGKIIETGPTEAIFSDPQQPFTRKLLAARLHPDPGAHPLTARDPI